MSDDIEFPAKLRPLFQPFRYKFAHGGRGSGKSWGFAGALLIQGATQPQRVLCAREVQKSIKDSVHQLLCDQIVKLNIGDYYDVFDVEIRAKNGGHIAFSGLSSQTAESLKSFEGLDKVWVEEAQSVVKRSWDILLPTVRKEESEIWGTLNPDMETDETYQRFVVNPPPNSFVVQMNWKDNPWFPAVLEQERLNTLARDPDNYANIWEGQPKRVSEGAIYKKEVEALYVEKRVRPVPYDPLLRVHTVWDLGWNDSMTIGMWQRSGSEVRCIDYIEDSHRTLDSYVAELEKKPYRYGFDFIPHDGAAKNIQTGKSTEEMLKAMGRRVKIGTADDIEEGIKAARMMFPRVYFDETKTARLLECLKRYKRHINKATSEPGAPLHDEYSHGCLDGSTLIVTRRGDVPICNVVVGDEVLTPVGYALVTHSGPTKVATELIEITMSNGAKLIATPEHRIFTTRGVLTADTLRYNDTILTMESAPCLSYQSIKSAGYRDAVIASFKAKSIGTGRAVESMPVKSADDNGYFILRSTRRFTESQSLGRKSELLMAICAIPRQITGSLSKAFESASTRYKNLMASGFIGSQRDISRLTLIGTRGSRCTDTFGKSITATSRPDFTFTTLMATRPTTALQTLKCFQLANTAFTTAKQTLGLEAKPTDCSLPPLATKQSNGTKAQKVKSGIAKTLLLHGQNGLRTLKTALNVVQRTKRLIQHERNTAPTIAKLERIAGQDATRLVYDLTVETHHCYLANGLLVSNCDMFRYTAMVVEKMTNNDQQKQQLPRVPSFGGRSGY